MANIAFTTFAIMKKAYGHPQVRGFEDLTPAAFRQAEQSPGFIARATELDDRTDLTNFERDWGHWGAFRVPRFYDGGFETISDTRASTLSLWKSIEAVRAFVYSGVHKSALAGRGDWFRKPEWPTYAMWWTDPGHTPTWSDAIARLELLHDKGPSREAFTFAHPFAAPGEEG
jgi:Domain of unknown function (DUF3291)